MKFITLFQIGQWEVPPFHWNSSEICDRFFFKIILIFFLLQTYKYIQKCTKYTSLLCDNCEFISWFANEEYIHYSPYRYSKYFQVFLTLGCFDVNSKYSVRALGDWLLCDYFVAAVSWLLFATVWLLWVWLPWQYCKVDYSDYCVTCVQLRWRDYYKFDYCVTTVMLNTMWLLGDWLLTTVKLTTVWLLWLCCRFITRWIIFWRRTETRWAGTCWTVWRTLRLSLCVTCSLHRFQTQGHWWGSEWY